MQPVSLTSPLCLPHLSFTISLVAALCQETIGDQSIVPRKLLQSIESRYDGKKAPLIDEDLDDLRTSLFPFSFNTYITSYLYLLYFIVFIDVPP